jgi:hypothetical protein
MRSKRNRLSLLAVLALALSVVVGPGVAQGAKVTEKAAGGTVPAETGAAPTVSTAFQQSFKLKGKKVKGKQILDVNVTVNATGSGNDTNDDLDMVLVSPKAGQVGLTLPSIGNAIVNLKFDDQAFADTYCNPLTFTREDCNYIQGGNGTTTGTVTGSFNAALNPQFKGGNPKGTWRLFTWDNDAVVDNTLGETTLEVKTGKKFAKE